MYFRLWERDLSKLLALCLVLIFVSCSSDSGKVSTIKDGEQNTTKSKDQNKTNENNASQNNSGTSVDDNAQSQQSFGKVYVNESATGTMPPGPSNLDDLLK